jgi:hypothetical protein
MGGLAAALIAGTVACPDSPSRDGADAGFTPEEDAGTPECDSDDDCGPPGWCEDGTCRVFEGGEGEGEGEQYLQTYLLQDDGDGLVETSVDESFGQALAISRARGVPAVFAAESEGDDLSGALLIHLEPFGAAPSTERVADVIATSNQRAIAIATDLDLDGDSDVLALGSLGFSVVLDDGSDFRLAATRTTNLQTTSVAVVDLDEDGLLDAYVPGLNDAYWTVRVVDGLVEADRQVRRWTVGHYSFCAASFAGAELEDGPVLLMVGRVCGADETVTGLPDGPDRLFLLDASLDEVASIDLGTEGGPAVTLRGSTAYITGFGFTPDPDNDGEPQGTLAVDVTTTSLGAPTFVAGTARIAGFADLDGDGVDSWVGYAQQEPSELFVEPPQGHHLSALGDADDDGRDEIFLHMWAWRPL